MTNTEILSSGKVWVLYVTMNRRGREWKKTLTLEIRIALGKEIYMPSSLLLYILTTFVFAKFLPFSFQLTIRHFSRLPQTPTPTLLVLPTSLFLPVCTLHQPVSPSRLLTLLKHFIGTFRHKRIQGPRILRLTFSSTPLHFPFTLVFNPLVPVFLVTILFWQTPGDLTTPEDNSRQRIIALLMYYDCCCIM